ncbi:type II toxin-antitoxin system VapC family toxin [Nocardia cyriacigeorgica]|uniref:Type II toxin-antitoxin system VapC family toxin n=1 Tax=Nocardia cyriacigeorgica TaxID=135487 RepID=A0A5R8PB08_9NOCA|nr:type II toxin-antitoxin system VapC family toxin [Nocardia cyriacigeorgica]TLG04662.1 type II toxin-antitoxin system VapC family toxin [Nocardia cyriacigeorgica]
MTGEVARGLVDTNVIILLDGLDPKELPEEMVISSVTMAELAAGPHYARTSGERAERIERLQNAEALFDPLPFDTRAARRYGHIVASVLASGRNPKPRRVDLMIAAIASVGQLPLYTVNPADFGGLEDLIDVRKVTHPDSR